MNILQMKIELDRRARNLISDLICYYRDYPDAVSGRHAS